MKKLLAFGLLLALGLTLAWHLGVFAPDFRERLQALLRSLGPWAPLTYVAVQFCIVLLGLPVPPVTLVGGLLFGPLAGALLTIAGVASGSACTFWIARRLAHDLVQRHLGEWQTELDKGLAANGLLFTLTWRLMPVLPDNVLNYGAGLTRVRFRDYLLGTLCGITPSAAVYTYVGSLATEANAPKILLAIGALALLALVPVALRRQSR